MISKRTNAALAACKARATRLGGFKGHVLSNADRASALASRRDQAAQWARDLAPIIYEIRATGVTSAHGIAAELTRRGIPTARGKSTWLAVQVQRLKSILSGMG